MKLKKLLKLDQSGFGHFEAVIAIAVVAMVAVVGVYISKHNHSHALAPTSSSANSTQIMLPSQALAGSNTTGGVPCPSGYTCFGTRPAPDTSPVFYITYYACLQTQNDTKEGQGIIYTVHGYAASSIKLSNGTYNITLVDDPGNPVTQQKQGIGFDPRWIVVSNGQWLYGYLEEVSHTVSMTQPNYILMQSTNLDKSYSGNWVGGETAGSLDSCPS